MNRAGSVWDMTGEEAKLSTRVFGEALGSILFFTLRAMEGHWMLLSVVGRTKLVFLKANLVACKLLEKEGFAFSFW